MKKTVPEKTVLVCDVCHEERPHLYTCPFCGREFCLMCDAIIMACAHAVSTCRKCQDDPILLEIVHRHAVIIQEAINARNAEIKAAGEKTRGVCANNAQTESE